MKRRKANNGKVVGKGVIIVRAYQKRSDELYVMEAEVGLDSSGNLTTEDVASALRLSGRLRVSKKLQAGDANAHPPQVIRPKNRYIYEPMSSHVVSRDEIEEFRDIHGHLSVTFNDTYSRKGRKHAEIVLLE
jgi:hypothetical protein